MRFCWTGIAPARHCSRVAVLLALLSWWFMGAPALAASVVERVDVHRDRVVVRFSEPVAAASSFVVDGPRRIALDIDGAAPGRVGEVERQHHRGPPGAARRRRRADRARPRASRDRQRRPLRQRRPRPDAAIAHGQRRRLHPSRRRTPAALPAPVQLARGARPAREQRGHDGGARRPPHARAAAHLRQRRQPPAGGDRRRPRRPRSRRARARRAAREGRDAADRAGDQGRAAALGPGPRRADPRATTAI